MTAKPTTLPRWSELAGNFQIAGVNETVPVSGKQDIGWVPGEEPPAGYLNWYQRVVYDWMQFLNDSPVFVPTTVGANGLNGTGNGAGSGLQGTGGPTSGTGVSGTGGAPNGVGAGAQGTGTGSGLSGTGGATSGAGAQGTGGPPNGNGLIGQGTGTGAGSQGTGGATGTGVKGIGGATSGDGVTGLGTAGNSRGGNFTGQGSAEGVLGTGGATGPGLKGAGGTNSAPLNLVPRALPSTLNDGDIWVETTSNVVKARIAAATKTILTSPIARADEPPVGQQVSASTGTFATTSATLVDVTVSGVTITTTGRPVVLVFQPAGATGAQLNMTGGSLSNIVFDRGGVTLANWKLITGTGGTMETPASLIFVDVVAAGTYTYKVRGNADGTNQLNVLNWVLVAYEL